MHTEVPAATAAVTGCRASSSRGGTAALPIAAVPSRVKQSTGPVAAFPVAGLSTTVVSANTHRSPAPAGALNPPSRPTVRVQPAGGVSRGLDAWPATGVAAHVSPPARGDGTVTAGTGAVPGAAVTQVESPPGPTARTARSVGWPATRATTTEFAVVDTTPAQLGHGTPPTIGATW